MFAEVVRLRDHLSETLDDFAGRIGRIDGEMGSTGDDVRTNFRRVVQRGAKGLGVGIRKTVAGSGGDVFRGGGLARCVSNGVRTVETEVIGRGLYHERIRDVRSALERSDTGNAVGCYWVDRLESV